MSRQPSGEAGHHLCSTQCRQPFALGAAIAGRTSACQASVRKSCLSRSHQARLPRIFQWHQLTMRQQGFAASFCQLSKALIILETLSPFQPWCCFQSTTSRTGRLQPQKLAGEKSTRVKRSHYALVDGGSAHCRTGSSHACHLEPACAQQSPRRCPEVDGNHSQQRVWSQGACSRSI